MTSELSDLIWGRLGLSAVRAVFLWRSRAEAAVTEPAAPSSWAAGLHHRRHAAAGPRPAGDSAALPRQGQLPDPADAPGRKRRGRGQGGAHALLPHPGAVDREARVSGPSGRSSRWRSSAPASPSPTSPDGATKTPAIHCFPSRRPTRAFRRWRIA